MGVLQVTVPGWHVPPTEPVREPSAIAEFEEVGLYLRSMFTASRIQLSGSAVQFSPEVTVPDWRVPPTEPVLEPSAIAEFNRNGGLNSAQRNINFFPVGSHGSEFQIVEVKLYFLRMVSESRIQLSILTVRFNHEGFPYDVSYTEISTGIQEWEDGDVDTFPWMEEATVYSPYSDSETSSDSEDSEECLSPEEKEVPLISHHLAGREVTDIALKLHAVREAFSMVFACDLTKNLMYVSGKKLLRHLTAANKQDVIRCQQAYDALIHILRVPSNQDSIRMELFDAQLHHLNVLDVLFEFIVFRCFLSDSAPVVTLEGGFLEQLSILIGTWGIGSWEPAAEEFYFLLVDHLVALLEDLFLQPVELYSKPVDLATVLRDLLKHYVQLMMEAMKNI